MRNVMKDRGDGTTEMSGFKSDPNVVTLIDTEDVQRLKELGVSWFYNRKRGYVQTSKKGITLELHRFINNTPPGKHTDHIVGGPEGRLDNRKSNLRTVTPAQNQKNRITGNDILFKGTLRRGWWFSLGGKRFKNYETQEDAIRACNTVGKALYGKVWKELDVEEGDINFVSELPRSYNIIYIKSPRHHINPWRVVSYLRGTDNLGHYATREDAERAIAMHKATGEIKIDKKDRKVYCIFGN